ncbi:hypothetical protein QAD02_004314 [Eretmocerus hayati]|uniref:Uncharacterized protein n=1 Tax=Eretmocerus hayati TaxID=131215 RepID=A0ACC2NQF6_9HYME|nr:hypothetical protein QAD02_004314 [Eretmocerus hayati]
MTDPIVHIENGSLRGVLKNSSEGYDYYAFLGIPYAKPPIGDLRFKDPEPPEKWSEVRDATKYGEKCVQYDARSKDIRGSEDCLFLNVYTKSLESNHKKCPVMIFIHGGGFMYGSGDDLSLGPDYLLRKDIILVTFNYRLGIFGFLNLEDDVAPGNQGLKDMIMVFKWVQKNIDKFNGDPNNVTAFGESAGSAALNYLLHSPLTTGLFHRAICQSGAGFNPWIRNKDPRKYIYSACYIMGKYTQDSKTIVEYLKNVDSQRIAQVQTQVEHSIPKLHQIFPYGPGPDPKAKEPVLPIPVEKAAEAGIDVPLIIGHNSCEGLSHLIDVGKLAGMVPKESFAEADRAFSKMVNPRNQEYFSGRYNLTLKDLRNLYYGKEKITQENALIYANMCSELSFVEGVHRAVKVQVGKNLQPTYYYQFSYDGELTLTKAMIGVPVPGACHFDEMEYLFYMRQRIEFGFGTWKKGTVPYKIMQRMTEMWTNFAIYGSPIPEISELLPVKWTQVNDGDNIPYLNIDKEIEMKIMPNIEQRFIAAKDANKSSNV